MVEQQKRRIVVVGAGIAGLRVAQRLHARKDCAVTLITDKDYFLFLPRLTEYFAGSAPTNRITLPIKQLWKGALVLGRAAMVNPQDRTVNLDNGQAISYDILVLALGSKVNFFGTQGSQYSYGFYTKEDADKLKEHVQRMLEAEDQATHTFVVVGGGPTGVETAYVLNRMVKAKRPQSKVMIVERGPGLLRMLPGTLSKAATEALIKSSIEIRTDLAVASITPLSVEVQRPDGVKEVIPCYTTVWAAGSAPATIPVASVQLTQRQEFPVNKTLQLEGHPEVFCLGDAAGSGTPKTAQAALQQAETVADNIEAMLAGKPLAPFTLKDKGTIIALEADTVGLVFGKVLKGFSVRTIRDRYYRHTVGKYG